MSETVRVKMAEYHVGASPDILVTIGLGSCVGIALYDEISKIGGLIHIMLPHNNDENNLKPAKYADTGIPLLIEKMVEAGANRENIIAKIAGGAHMFSSSPDMVIQIGKRNIEAVYQILEENNIPIVGEDLGKDYGRTMEFYTEDGRVKIRSYRAGDKFL
ncbi:MAG TPA: chemotaxis protein CheD [Halanaerobiaceae bacterium]|jgi:chemotaxis protein CheD|nr:chemotaxis protein CheD [Bacillota bacterium]HHU91709.1 chemotaxis protein CheD [Halanaerobiaceae bacterium]HOA40410.1 chemotaxis protein CheD [Halanaerobiales bacterium]HPZ62556.1 chemotaxis protein CheD [Halanaerobiales bacterium]HQD03148.1 chemotaxis protein CheD [Halanaerobiales bacterium]